MTDREDRAIELREQPAVTELPDVENRDLGPDGRRLACYQIMLEQLQLEHEELLKAIKIADELINSLTLSLQPDDVSKYVELRSGAVVALVDHRPPSPTITYEHYILSNDTIVHTDGRLDRTGVSMGDVIGFIDLGRYPSQLLAKELSNRLE